MPTPEAGVIELLFNVVNKEGESVPFRLNSAQRMLDEVLSKLPRPRILVPKARQEGVSTYFLARNTVRCLGMKNRRSVIVSHESDATDRMLQKVHYFLQNLNGPPAEVRLNRNEVIFEKTNSVMWIGTAGSRKFGRGDTITDLHCSEIAYWPDPKSLMAGLLQAVPKGSGSISIESTGNGMGNHYHRMCMRAAKGQGSFGLCFLPWHTFSEYTLQVSEDEAREVLSSLSEELEEPELVEKYGLTAGQLLWRRQVLDELDFDLALWRQEYPVCLDDCFQAAGGSVFQKVNFIPTADWQKSDGNLHTLAGHPKHGHRYVLGCDVSAGVGKDSSVIEIFDLDEDEQVGEWISNKISPDAFAHKIAALGREFNLGYIGVENNNHGLVTVKELSGIYPADRLYKTPALTPNMKLEPVSKLLDLGVRTTSRSKPLMIGSLRKALAKRLKIHSEIFKSELSTFIEHESGAMAAADNCNDDTVMAAAVAEYVRERAALVLTNRTRQAQPKDAGVGSFDHAIKELRDKHRKDPFPTRYSETWDANTLPFH